MSRLTCAYCSKTIPDLKYIGGMKVNICDNCYEISGKLPDPKTAALRQAVKAAIDKIR